MNRVLRAAVLAFAIVAALAFAAGCGSDEEQSEYVDDLNAAQNTFLAEMTEAASQPPPTSPRQAGDLIGAMREALQSAADEFDAIEPPEEVVEQHDQLIATMQDLADQMTELGDTISNGTRQEIQQGIVELQKGLSSAQTEVTSLIDQINAELN